MAWPIVCGLFLLSGFTALVYQIVWMRHLTLSFGASAFAVAAVLIAFMGGMSAGAFVFGRFADRRSDPLRLYGLLEAGIGLYALALPFVIERLCQFYVLLYQKWEPGFYTISLVRLAVSMLVLFIPTAAMGGTLPLLCALLKREGTGASRRVATLYGINTLGGVAGCVGAGFLLIPLFGLDGATYLCVAINLAIGVACLAVHPRRVLEGQEVARGDARTTARPAAPKRGPAPPVNDDRVAVFVAITAIALSGFTAMLYETLWTRILSMIIGTTVYAFTTMLAAFLMGIVLGNWLYYLRPPKRPALVLGLTQALVGVWVLLVLPYCDELPFVFLKVFRSASESWVLFQLLRFGLLWLLLIVPTTLAGFSFPLCVQMLVQRGGETGRKVGCLYGFNTIGAILGAFVGGFVLIPFIGIQQGMVIGGTASVFTGLLVLAAGPGLPAMHRITWSAAIISAGLAGVMLLRPWDLCSLNSGAYVYAKAYEDVRNLKAALREYRPIFYREGVTATVAVIHSPGDTLSLTIEGKTDASTGRNADMSTQILLSHLPALLSEKSDRALVIGLGSGVSLGSLLRHPVSRVDVVEISREVVEASECFREYNYDALDDPRVDLIVADGRHHLQRTGRQYDLIVSQPSNPWITGNANLFTREYYRLMASRLTGGGRACQWLPSYQMSKEMIGVIVKTFAGEFEHVSLWTSSVVGDLFLIGSKRDFQIDYDRFAARVERADVISDLARIQMNHPAAVLGRTFKFGPAGVRRFLTEFGEMLPLNTDSYPVVEFSSPRYLLEQRVAREFNTLQNLKGDLEGLAALMRFRDARQRRSFLEEVSRAMADSPDVPANADPPPVALGDHAGPLGH